MRRRDWLRNSAIAGSGLLLSKYLKRSHPFLFYPLSELRKEDFGDGFKWGVAAASYQTEGAWDTDGKSE
jgi:hypothetical protein